MPHFDIVVKWEAPNSFRAQSVIGTYTLLAVKLEKRFKGEIPIENLKWNIGVIVGRSGTGKTSIAKQCWPESYIRGFSYSKPCFLDDFAPAELKVKDIEAALNATGFNTPPDWLKRYDFLSQGEKMRADVARALTLNQDLVVFDEWTSVVDRTVAQIASLAISKQIRRRGKKFIAVTCHYDVIDWLEPDWVFSTDDMKFVKKNESTQKLDSKSVNVDASSGRLLAVITI
jgi:ABC-type ATPase with predicted acetyltransferase domain